MTANSWAWTGINEKFGFADAPVANVFNYISGVKEINDPVGMFQKQMTQKINGQVQRLMLAKKAAENPDEVLQQYTDMMGSIANHEDPILKALVTKEMAKHFRYRMPFLSEPEANAVYLSMVTEFADRYANMITMANPVALRIAQDIGTELSAPIQLPGRSGSRRSGSRRSSRQGSK